jgi:hypothetical protein
MSPDQLDGQFKAFIDPANGHNILN